MRFPSRVKISLSGAAALVVTIALLIVTLLGLDRPTRYYYHGQDIGPQGMKAVADSGKALSCVSQPTEWNIVHELTDVYVCFDTEAEADQNSAQIAPLVQYYDTLMQEGRLIPFVPQVLTSLAVGAAVWLVGKWLPKRIGGYPKRKIAETQTVT